MKSEEAARMREAYWIDALMDEEYLDRTPARYYF
jgi:hypothetical protein